MAGSDQPRDFRSYGRRRGRKPSRHQADLLADVLPEVSVAISDPPPWPLTRLFAPEVREVWLEIGFGGGEHLVWQARHNAEIGLIGCEPFQDGVVKLLSAMQEQGLANIRLFPDDARPLLRWLPETSIARAFVLFPDPWPKTRHRKRRLLSAGTLRNLARVMPSGAELRVATDIGDYAQWILLAVREEGSFSWRPTGPQDWRQRTADWPQTRYEQKAQQEGRQGYYLRFFRR